MIKYSEVIVPSDRKCCSYNEHFRHSEQGDNYEFVSAGFKVWHFLSNTDFHGAVALPVADDSVIMCFCMEQATLNLGYESILLETERHILTYFTNSNSTSFLIKEGQRLAVFLVMLDVDVFLNYLPVNGSTLFTTFKEDILQKKDVVLKHDSSFFASLEMKRVINSILASSRDDECKHLFFKAKILELLSLQLEQFTTVNKAVFEKKLKKEELSRVEEVKSILENNPEESYTLLGLARLVGTNDASLKKHFKIAYNTTVFNYLNRCRMEKAHLILQEHDYKVSQVAEEVGFKYASHFSAAFKKYFGYSPAELKKCE